MDEMPYIPPDKVGSSSPFKAILFVIVALAMIVVGTVLGAILVPLAVVGVLYFIGLVITYKE